MVSPRVKKSGKHYTELIVYENCANQFYLTGLSGSQEQHKTQLSQHFNSKTSYSYFNELPSHLQNIYEENKTKNPIRNK